MVFLADYLVPQIVFLGDSITQFSANFTNGIVPRLQNEFQREYDVVNRGFSGYNTEFVSEIADPVFAGLGYAPVDYSVIFLGTNDLASNKLQHVDVEDYSLNLAEIVDISSAYANNTIVVGPALVNEDLWPDRSNLDFYEYSEAAKAVAEKAGVPFVDLYSAFHEFFNESSVLPPKYASDYQFNATALNATVPSNISANSSVWVNKRSAPAFGFIADNSTSLNDTVYATNVTKYPASNSTYLGKAGNPKNKLLSQVLFDGLHFNNRGYDIFYKALKPYITSNSTYWPLPDYSVINSTDYLTKYLEASYLAAELNLNQTANGTYYFSGYNLSNLTVGNTSFGNVSISNFTDSLDNITTSLYNSTVGNFTSNFTNITLSSLGDAEDVQVLQQAIDY